MSAESQTFIHLGTATYSWECYGVPPTALELWDMTKTSLLWMTPQRCDGAEPNAPVTAALLHSKALFLQIARNQIVLTEPNISVSTV